VSIVITGATGQLGRLAVEALLRRGVPAEQIVATGRRTETLTDLAARGITIRRADFDDQASLREAFADAERLLLVSGNEFGQRTRQHGNAVQAAKDAGVGLIAYTSILRADTSTLPPAEEHRETEALLAESGVPHVLLRNSWYTEVYTGQLPLYLEHGIAGAAGDARISAATRGDYAEAAASALLDDGHAGATYELGGPAFTMTELAQVVSEVAGRPVSYTDMSGEQYTQALLGAGLPEPVAVMLTECDRGAAAGDLFVETTDLEKLLGRPATSLHDAVADALGAPRA
jgi:NAD(P)H dehydrogenase (quinone)